MSDDQILDFLGEELHVGQRVVIRDYRQDPPVRDIDEYILRDNRRARSIGRQFTIERIRSVHSQKIWRVALAEDAEHMWPGYWLLAAHVGLKGLIHRYRKEVHDPAIRP